ncbi:hypothetical protein [Azotobacter salinestris]|uniref:hypothetical protein n=1 Tax=Azotobacter salinestris TaxID=69964 RepID=UPI001266D511|nr:hypothetical protein [Azotobacter salinestris]
MSSASQTRSGPSLVRSGLEPDRQHIIASAQLPAEGVNTRLKASLLFVCELIFCTLVPIPGISSTRFTEAFSMLIQEQDVFGRAFECTVE